MWLFLLVYLTAAMVKELIRYASNTNVKSNECGVASSESTADLNTIKARLAEEAVDSAIAIEQSVYSMRITSSNGFHKLPRLAASLQTPERIAKLPARLLNPFHRTILSPMMAMMATSTTTAYDSANSIMRTSPMLKMANLHFCFC